MKKEGLPEQGIEEKIQETIEGQLRVAKDMNFGITNTATMIRCELELKGLVKQSLSPVGEVTDEEIDQEVSLMTNYITSHSLAFSEGAKWMRDRLNRGIEWDSGEIIGRVKDRHKELRGKGHHWSSFYHGWLEGRVDMLKLSKMRSQALSSTEKEDAVGFIKWYSESMNNDEMRAILETRSYESAYDLYKSNPPKQ